MPTIMKFEVRINVPDVNAIPADQLARFRVEMVRQILEGHVGGVLLTYLADVSHTSFFGRGVAVDVKEALAVEPVDVDLLLKKYMRHVAECEGATFVENRRHSTVQFTAAEERRLEDIEHQLDREAP